MVEGKFIKWIKIIVIKSILMVNKSIRLHSIGIICGIKEYYIYNNFKLTI